MGGNEKVFARPNENCDSGETAISCRGPEPAGEKKRKRHTSSREEKEVDVQMLPCGKATNGRTQKVRESGLDYFGRNRVC